jgi:hypothetical protein
VPGALRFKTIDNRLINKWGEREPKAKDVRMFKDGGFPVHKVKRFEERERERERERSLRIYWRPKASRGVTCLYVTGRKHVH